MAKIIKFPRVGAVSQMRDLASKTKAPSVPKLPPAFSRTTPTPWWRCILYGTDAAAWIMIVLLSPVWKWIAVIDMLFQLLKTMYYWDTPGAHAGWIAVLHIGVFLGLYFYVLFHKPKWI